GLSCGGVLSAFLEYPACRAVGKRGVLRQWFELRGNTCYLRTTVVALVAGRCSVSVQSLPAQAMVGGLLTAITSGEEVAISWRATVLKAAGWAPDTAVTAAEVPLFTATSSSCADSVEWANA